MRVISSILKLNNLNWILFFSLPFIFLYFNAFFFVSTFSYMSWTYIHVLSPYQFNARWLYLSIIFMFSILSYFFSFFFFQIEYTEDTNVKIKPTKKKQMLVRDEVKNKICVRSNIYTLMWFYAVYQRLVGNANNNNNKKKKNWLRRIIRKRYKYTYLTHMHRYLISKSTNNNNNNNQWMNILKRV